MAEPNHTQERVVNLAVEWRGDAIIVTSGPDRGIPPVTLAVYVSNGHASTYLTMDEAARLRKALLDAATEVARAQRAEVRPGVDPELAEDMEILADALVPDGEAS